MSTYWFKGCSNKAAAKALYRQLMMKHHPDRGGSTVTAQEITEQFRMWPRRPVERSTSASQSHTASNDSPQGFRSHRRAWTAFEDDLVMQASAANWEHGITNEDAQYKARLRDVAKRIGRTYVAVRKRAERIKSRSYRKHYKRGYYAA